MTVREYLEKPKMLKEEIQNDKDRIAEMRSIVERCTTRLGFTAGTNPSKNEDAFESVMLDITEAEEKLEKKIISLAKLEFDILNLIGTLNNSRQQAVLIAKYLDGLTWGNIGRKAHVCSRQAQRLEQEAIAILERTTNFVVPWR